MIHNLKMAATIAAVLTNRRILVKVLVKVCTGSDNISLLKTHYSTRNWHNHEIIHLYHKLVKSKKLF